MPLTWNEDELLLEHIDWPLFLLGPVLHGINPFLRQCRIEMGSEYVDVRNIGIARHPGSKEEK